MTTLPFICDAARSRRVAASGLSLHLLEWGEQGHPALLFLHGGAAHAHWFDGVTGAFVDRFHVVALDQRGHGESQWADPPAYGTEEFTGDLNGVMDALGWRHTVVIGHSMGGHNALTFAAWYPERVRGLVIVDARPAIPADRLEGLRTRGRRALRGHASAEEAVASFRLLPPDTVADPALMRHLARQGIVERDGGFAYRFDPASYGSRRPADGWQLVSRIQAPTLIVRGEHSPILPRDMAERMRDAIPKASLVEFEGAYHHVTLDKPAEFTRVLSEFLEGL